LQTKKLKLDVLAQNPLFFEMFKQKLYREFQGSLFRYWPLLEYVNIRDFQWQVMWLWKFVINTPTDEDTYEWMVAEIYSCVNLLQHAVTLITFDTFCFQLSFDMLMRIVIFSSVRFFLFYKCIFGNVRGTNIILTSFGQT